VKRHLTHGASAALLLAALTGTGCHKKPEAKNPPSHPEKQPVLPRKNYDTARLFNGLSLKTSVTCGQGTDTAIGTIAENQFV